ncbi:MAG TPA: hypothetical protein VGF99_12105, partial [Myxococcota bacterium]
MAEPFGVTDALSVAAEVLMFVAASVVTDGASGEVTNELMAPKLVPSEFCAMAHTKYVVPGNSELTVCVKAMGVLPAPSDEPPEMAGARVPKV